MAFKMILSDFITILIRLLLALLDVNRILLYIHIDTYPWCILVFRSYDKDPTLILKTTGGSIYLGGGGGAL